MFGKIGYGLILFICLVFPESYCLSASPAKTKNSPPAIEKHCVSGDCQNGYGVFEWSEKQAGEGDFKNGGLYKGYVLLQTEPLKGITLFYYEGLPFSSSEWSVHDPINKVLDYIKINSKQNNEILRQEITKKITGNISDSINKTARAWVKPAAITVSIIIAVGLVFWFLIAFFGEALFDINPAFYSDVFTALKWTAIGIALLIPGISWVSNINEAYARAHDWNIFQYALGNLVFGLCGLAGLLISFGMVFFWLLLTPNILKFILQKIALLFLVTFQPHKGKKYFDLYKAGKIKRREAVEKIYTTLHRPGEVPTVFHSTIMKKRIEALTKYTRAETEFNNELFEYIKSKARLGGE